LQREILQEAMLICWNPVFWRIRCIGLEHERILRGGSKFPHR